MIFCIKLLSKLVSDLDQIWYKTTCFLQILYDNDPIFTLVCTKFPSPAWLSVSKLVSSLYQTRIKTCIKLVSVWVQNDMFYTNMIQIFSEFYPSLYQVSEPSLTFCIKTSIKLVSNSYQNLYQTRISKSTKRHVLYKYDMSMIRVLSEFVPYVLSQVWLFVSKLVSNSYKIQCKMTCFLQIWYKF